MKLHKISNYSFHINVNLISFLSGSPPSPLSFFSFWISFTNALIASLSDELPWSLLQLSFHRITWKWITQKKQILITDQKRKRDFSILSLSKSQLFFITFELNVCWHCYCVYPNRVFGIQDHFSNKLFLFFCALTCLLTLFNISTIQCAKKSR